MKKAQKVTDFEQKKASKLPIDWKVSNLDDVADLVMGQSPPGKTYNEIGKGIPFLQGKAEFGLLYPSHKKFTTKPLKIAPEGSILISVRAPVGDVNLADKKYCIGRGLASLISKKTDNIFLFYMLIFNKPSLKNEGTGSTFKSINKSKLKNFKIPVPPLEEQKKIAGVLSAVQDAIEKTEAVIQATKDLKKSMMKHLFTYGPVPLSEKENVPLKETEIGMIPEEWGIKKYEDVANINQKNANPKKDFPDKLFEYIDINSIDNTVNKITETKRFFGKNAPSRARRLVITNDVIISTVRPYLRSFAIVPKSYNKEVCSTGFSVLTSKKTVLPRYLFYVSISDIIINQFNKQMRGANYPAINITNVRNTLIPLPSITEQKKITDILSYIDNKIQAEENKKKTLEDLFNSLLHNLMTAKIRVNDLDLESVEI